MPHAISYTEEIDEHGYCQQRSELRTGDKYLYKVDGTKRLRIVKSVYFDKYVWEDVAKWTTVIEEYLPDEYVLCEIHTKTDSNKLLRLPVFIANGMISVLSCDKDSVSGELVIPSIVGNWHGN